ncbi:nucleotide pyrophosphatase/phosphodiesterase family protein [Actinoplanes sp. NPDC048796]
MTGPLVVPGDRLPDNAFQPVRPAYGSASLAEVLPSASAVLGVPGAADTLGLRERLDGVDRIAVLLVDGLGAYQLPVMHPYTPVLNELVTGSRTVTTGFPSTTPVSLVTVGTGAPPGAHGVLGFTTRRPDGRLLNHVHWNDDPDPAAWQPVPTRFELAEAAGVRATQVVRPEFEGSGLTVAAYRGAAFRSASEGAELADQMLEALAAGPSLVYGYHADLDKTGHLYGVDSRYWRMAAQGVDRLVDRLVHGLPPRSALLVIADHGQLNVPVESRYDMADDPALSDGVVTVAGEPRVRYLHAEPGATDDLIAAWRSVMGGDAWVMTRDEIIDGGWFGPVPAGHRSRVGDVVIVCQNRAVALASGWEPPPVGRLIAYHGSVTAAEMTVPLLIARA